MKSGNGRLDNIQREVDNEIIEEKQMQNAEHNMIFENNESRSEQDEKNNWWEKKRQICAPRTNHGPAQPIGI